MFETRDEQFVESRRGNSNFGAASKVTHRNVKPKRAMPSPTILDEDDDSHEANEAASSLTRHIQARPSAVNGGPSMGPSTPSRAVLDLDEIREAAIPIDGRGGPPAASSLNGGNYARNDFRLNAGPSKGNQMLVKNTLVVSNPLATNSGTASVVGSALTSTHDAVKKETAIRGDMGLLYYDSLGASYLVVHPENM